MQRKLIFDFDGVFNSGQVMFFSAFGGRVEPRYIVSKSTKLARVVYTGHDFVLRKKADPSFQ